MPQMAPLNWLILFIFFSLIFILFNTMNFYTFIDNPKETKNNKNLVTLNWKW